MTTDANPPGDEEDEVGALIDEIETAIEDFADDRRLTQAAVDTAIYTCAVQHGVDSGIEKEAFLAMLSEMFDESREMGALEDRMSLTRGEA